MPGVSPSEDIMRSCTSSEMVGCMLLVISDSWSGEGANCRMTDAETVFVGSGRPQNLEYVGEFPLS